MIDPVKVWILLSAVLCAGGWGLSALHLLNVQGYAALLLLALYLMWQWPDRIVRKSGIPLWRRLHRLCAPAPLMFVLLAALSLLSGAMYPVDTGDPSMYRIPRVLHWLNSEQWHWIRTVDYRLNTRGCGFEWMMAPLILFSKSDRLVFTLNLVSFLLLPGLLFSVFRGLGVRSRVAWWWMWLTPAGLCYCLQAGSAANDAYEAVFVLASIRYALRAHARQSKGDLWLSLVATALVTAGKQTNIPLALLGLIASAPSWHLLLRRPLASGAVALFCLSASGMPLIVFNEIHGFTWAGIPGVPFPGDPLPRLAPLHSPLWGLVGNMFTLTVENAAPPFCFFCRDWNHLMTRFLSTPIGVHFGGFEYFAMLTPYPNEQAAGLGLPLLILLMVSIGWSIFRHPRLLPRKMPLLVWALLLTPWLLLILFMMTIGGFENARMLAPYYVGLMPAPLLLAGQELLTRKIWWHRLSIASMMGAAAWVVFLPQRPLWGASFVLERALRHNPNSKFVRAALTVYTISSDTQDGPIFGRLIPAETTIIGYATDLRGLEPQLWRPFFRRVERVLPGDTEAELERRGVQYLVVDESFLRLFGYSLAQVEQQFGAEEIDRRRIRIGLAGTAYEVYLLRVSFEHELRAEAAPATKH